MILKRFVDQVEFSNKDAQTLRRVAENMWQTTGKPVEECWFLAALDVLLSKGVIKHLSEAEMHQDKTKSFKYKSSAGEESKQLSLGEKK